MAIPIIKINALLERWAANEFPIEFFTVSNVLSTIGLDQSYYEAVLKYLMSKEGYELIPKILLYCPKDHKGEPFSVTGPIDEEEIFDCWCGEEYNWDPNNAFLVFDFSKEFKLEALKKKSDDEGINEIGVPTTQNNKVDSIARLLESGLGPLIFKTLNVQGDVHVMSHNTVGSNNRNMNGANFSGANFNGNANFLSDNVTQTMGSGVSEDVFKKLFDTIEKIEEADEREMASNDAQQLQHAIADNKKSLARKIFGRLPDVIKLADIGVEITKLFN